MSSNISEAIERAKYLLANTRNAAMATVNADGSPHNTPFFFIRDNALEYVYWGSHPDSLHSQNVMRDGRIFVVLYEANHGGGLYLEADDAHLLEGDELIKGLTIHNALRVKEGKEELAPQYYLGTAPQRMYAAKIRRIYVNYGERDATGKLIRDVRQEITSADLGGYQKHD